MNLIHLVFISAIILESLSIYSSVFGLTSHSGIIFILLAFMINAGKISFTFLFYEKWHSFKVSQKYILLIICSSFIFLSIYGSYSFLNNELSKSINKEELVVSQLFILEKKQENINQKLTNLSKKEQYQKEYLNNQSIYLDKQIYELRNRTILDNIEAGAIIGLSKSWNISIVDTVNYISIILSIILDPLAILLLLLGLFLQQKSIWPLKNYLIKKGYKTLFPKSINGLAPYIQEEFIYKGFLALKPSYISSLGKKLIPKLIISGTNVIPTFSSQGNKGYLCKKVSFGLISSINQKIKSGDTKLNNYYSFGEKHFFIFSKRGTNSITYKPVRSGEIKIKIPNKLGSFLSKNKVYNGTPIFIRVKSFPGLIMEPLNLISSGKKLKLNKLAIKGRKPKLNSSIIPGNSIFNLSSKSLITDGEKLIFPKIINGTNLNKSSIQDGLKPILYKETIIIENYEPIIEIEKTDFEKKYGVTEEAYDLAWERPGDYLKDYEKINARK